MLCTLCNTSWFVTLSLVSIIFLIYAKDHNVNAFLHIKFIFLNDWHSKHEWVFSGCIYTSFAVSHKMLKWLKPCPKGLLYNPIHLFWSILKILSDGKHIAQVLHMHQKHLHTTLTFLTFNGIELPLRITLLYTVYTVHVTSYISLSALNAVTLLLVLCTLYPSMN